MTTKTSRNTSRRNIRKTMHLIVLAGLVACIQAGTNVGGVFQTNTVWNQAGSPYYLTDNIGIPSNVSLTIQAGVRVIFGLNGSFKILIRGGRLLVNGTSQRSVQFSGGSSDINTNYMLTFLASHLSKSSMTYAHFTGPQPAIRLMDTPDCLYFLWQNAYPLKIKFAKFKNTTISTDGYLSRNPNNSKFIYSWLVHITNESSGNRVFLNRCLSGSGDHCQVGVRKARQTWSIGN